jgi:hypothetical protein
VVAEQLQKRCVEEQEKMLNVAEHIHLTAFSTFEVQVTRVLK